MEEMMKKRELGKSGIEVAPWALGGNVFGWTADEETSFDILDSFVEAGFNLIDTADTYSRWVPGHVGGESEPSSAIGSKKEASEIASSSPLRSGWTWGTGKRDWPKDISRKKWKIP